MSYRKIIGIIFSATLATAPPALCQEPDTPPNEPIRTVPAEIDADAKSSITGINAFSLDLYRRTLAAGENHFLSPASVSIAVALAYRGARGATATELERVMHFGKPPRDYLRATAPLLETMTFAGPRRELRTANALWLQEGMPLVPDYEQDMTRFARAGLQRVNFRDDPDTARLKVNGWVAETTRDKIRDLLLPDDVRTDTAAILVNAIYWKGGWAEAFDKGLTKVEPFTQLNSDTVSTPLMHQRSHFRVLERGDIRAILLPYVGNEIEMAVFLPDSAKGLPKFEEKLTARDLSDWLDRLASAEARETILTLPRMHIEWRQDLMDSIKAMGAPTPFSGGADFSGIATTSGPDGVSLDAGLKIGKVIHKTYIDVDENGSEAAAATAVVAVVITSGRSGPPPPPPFTFRADKPFLFLLRDRRTGLILFMGRYVKAPAESGAR